MNNIDVRRSARNHGNTNDKIETSVDGKAKKCDENVNPNIPTVENLDTNIEHDENYIPDDM